MSTQLQAAYVLFAVGITGSAMCAAWCIRQLFRKPVNPSLK